MSNNKDKTIYVCMAKSCMCNFSADTLKHAQKLAEKGKIQAAKPTTCLGRCGCGPNVIINNPQNKLEIHENVLPRTLDKILESQ